MSGQVKRHAFILGGTGAVGQQVLAQLLASEKFAKLHVPTRRPLELTHKKLIHYDFAEFYRPWKLEAQVNDFFYCFGSTQKKAGDAQKFRELELRVAHEALVVAKQMGARRFYLVSSRGVDPQSLSAYLRTKAEVEKVLKDHYFQAFYVYRPSLLIAPRTELRPAELVAQKTLAPLKSPLQRYLPNVAPVEAEQVARAMVLDALRGDEGYFVRENRQIIELASLVKKG